MNMESKLQIRLPAKLKKEFIQITEENSHNGSDLIRKWIEDYIKENSK